MILLFLNEYSRELHIQQLKLIKNSYELENLLIKRGDIKPKQIHNNDVFFNLYGLYIKCKSDKLWKLKEVSRMIFLFFFLVFPCNSIIIF